jgi:DNA-binding IclR family transcriptional regulator
MDPVFDIPTLVLAAIRIAEADCRPMTARDLGFMLGVPQEHVDSCLDMLVQTGSISQDGDQYRYDLTRSPTAAEEAKFQHLLEQLKEARLLTNTFRLHS